MPPRDRIRASHMSRQFAVSCIAVSAGLILAGTGLAQQSQLKIEATQKLKQSRDRPEQAEQRAREPKVDLEQIDQELAKRNAQLQERARKVQAAEARLTRLEAHRDELEAQKAMVEGSLAQRRSSIAGLLSTMQRMGRNPPPVIITKREDALEMVRSAMLLARALPELQAQIDDLIVKLGEHDRILKKLAVAREQVQSETDSLSNARTALMEIRQEAQAAKPGWSDEFRRRMDDISIRAKDPGELIAEIEKELARITGHATFDGAEAEKQASADVQPRDLQGAPLQMGPLKAPSAPGQQPVEKGPQVAVLLSPGAGAQAGAPGRMKPAVPFHLARGQLPFPAAGQRILSFGDTTSTGRKSQGIVIETRHGAQITSPCDGWVVYAGEFRSYGQLLIINAGGGYHVLLAGLSHIDAQLGQFVLAGEPVGTMSTPKGKARDNAPVLYVEFRKEGRPIDPAPWWHDGQQQKVQG